MHNIYINNISFLQHSYMLWYSYVILREFLITYTKATKLIKWKLLYEWLFQWIDK